MSRYASLSTSFKKYDLPKWKKEQKDLTLNYPVVLDDDWFKNSFGSIRWNLIRRGYEDRIININDVLRLYIEWRDTSEYLVLDAYNENNDRLMSVFVKASKRGNAVYKKAVAQKFSFLDSLEPLQFFNDDLGVNKTPMIFLTPTIDIKRYPIDEAYRLISKELHDFEKRLVYKYGKFVKLRVWEAHKSGYPHSHLVYYFLNHEFNVFAHYNREGKKTFRISDGVNSYINKHWKMGHVDVQAVQDTCGAFAEVLKYVTKSIWSEKGDLTNAMLTLHQKQAFSISSCDPFRESRNGDCFIPIEDMQRDFIGAIWGMDAYIDLYTEAPYSLKEPESTHLVEPTMSNCPNIHHYEYTGMILGSDLSRFIPNFKDELVYEVLDPSIDLVCCINLYGVSK